MLIIRKINTIASFTLIFIFLAYMISGVLYYERIINPNISGFIHLKLLFYPAILSYGYHSSYQIFTALRRKKMFNIFGKLILAVYILIVLSVVIGYALIQ